jgi:hypothetical protein
VTVLKASLATRKGKLKLVGAVPVPADLSGTMSVVMGDGNGATFCGPVADVTRQRSNLVMRGVVGLGSINVKMSQKAGGTLIVRGRGLDLAAIDDPNIVLGLSVGGLRFSAGGAFRDRGRGRWALP